MWDRLDLRIYLEKKATTIRLVNPIGYLMEACPAV
jgi:hypothetical protein